MLITILLSFHIPIFSTFSSGFFSSSQHKVLSIKFGRALDSLDLIACQPKDCPKFHCLSGELPVGLPLRRSFIACPWKVRLTLKAAAACSRLSAAAKQEIKLIRDSLDILLFIFCFFIFEETQTTFTSFQAKDMKLDFDRWNLLPGH